jgi:hypothetical protein
MGNICYLGAEQNTRQANLVEWIFCSDLKIAEGCSIEV